MRSPKRDVVVPPGWAPFYEQTRIPAGVWAGNTLRLTGHTGEDAAGDYPAAAEDQLRGTFVNITETLAHAGAGWSDVVEINSYHVGFRTHADLLLPIAAEFLDDPYPAWTAVGVTELFPPDALVEVRCVAVVGRR